jgi:hypothetical protein
MLASLSVAWQRARLHDTCVNGLLKSPCGSAVSFCSFSFWFLRLLSPKRTQLRVLLVIVFHEVGFPDYISRPPATLKRTDLTTRVLPLLTTGPSQLRLQPDCSRAPVTGGGCSRDYTAYIYLHRLCTTTSTEVLP